MKDILITGVGIKSEVISHMSDIREKRIEDYEEKLPPVDQKEILDKQKTFSSAKIISREDRSLLNPMSCLAIDAAIQAFEQAEEKAPFSAFDKANFPIFIGNETPEHNLHAIDDFLFDRNRQLDYCLSNMGEIKKYLNPLDMLRLLTTNPLYHLSKIFSLNGGGYPIKRMSLSGLCALQEACIQLQFDKSKALVTAVGDLTNPENLCAFSKMGLLKTEGSQNGIIPSFGAASLILETKETCDLNFKKALAKIHTVKSVYKSATFVEKNDWVNLLGTVKNEMIIKQTELSLENKSVNPSFIPPCVVLYDNGVDSLAHPEKAAIMEVFPESKHFSYKKVTGYTGKANNLIDLVLSLSDKRIPLGSHIIINGIGTSVGFGTIWLEKVNHV